MLLAALVFNNLTGRAYPHVPPHPAPDHATAHPAPMERVGITAADIDAVVKGFDQVLDVSRGDLMAILRQAQFLSYRRQCGHTDCGAIMSRHVVAVAPHVPLREAVALLRRHHIKALPVTDEQAHVLGIVTQGDLLDKAAWNRFAPRLALAQRVHLTLERGRAPHGSVEDVMTRHVRTVRPGTPVIDLALLVLEAGLHYVPVVDDDDKLVGIVTPSDLVAALVADGATRDLKA